jgi:hypothetical protein
MAQLLKEKWKFGKRFVHSVTYDEGLEALLGDTLEIHQRFGMPGHVSMVAAQVGKVRTVKGSTFEGMRHLSAEQIHGLRALGWGVSCHSMNHLAITPESAQEEVVRARKVLEDALGVPITMFIVPGDNNSYPAARAVAEEAGYLSILTLWDALNDHATDLLRLHRTPLIEEGFSPFYSVYDPYCRLHEALETGGWICEYTHIARTPVVAATKEVRVETLARRFEKVEQVGGDQVWKATPDDVVDYMLVHKATKIEAAGPDRFRLKVAGLPDGVQNRELTLRCKGIRPRARLLADGEPIQKSARAGRDALLTISVRDGLEISAREQ